MSEEQIKPLRDTRNIVIEQNSENLTVKNFLSTAMQLLGKVLYVFGGGWGSPDPELTEGVKTVAGISDEWIKFYNENAKSDYNYELFDFQDKKGLDCTGFVGWSIFNFIQPADHDNTFVVGSRRFANVFSEYKVGDKQLFSVTNRNELKRFLPGSVMASNTEGHVYIVVGQCDDGSVVVLHSSPPGVRLCGTPDRSGNENSQALEVAERYMRRYCNDFYSKFPDCKKPIQYLTEYEQVSWNTDVVHDPDDYLNKSPDYILNDVFSCLVVDNTSSFSETNIESVQSAETPKHRHHRRQVSVFNKSFGETCVSQEPPEMEHKPNEIENH